MSETRNYRQERDDARAENKRLRAVVESIQHHGNHPDWKWWCKACGSLSNDGECDCTRVGDPDTQILIRNP